MTSVFQKVEKAVENLGSILANEFKAAITVTEDAFKLFLTSPTGGSMTADMKTILVHFLEFLLHAGFQIVEKDVPIATPIVADLEGFVDKYLTALATGQAPIITPASPTVQVPLDVPADAASDPLAQVIADNT